MLKLTIPDDFDALIVTQYTKDVDISTQHYSVSVINEINMVCSVANSTYKGRTDVDCSCLLCTGHQSRLQGLLQLLQ